RGRGWPGRRIEPAGGTRIQRLAGGIRIRRAGCRVRAAIRVRPGPDAGPAGLAGNPGAGAVPGALAVNIAIDTLLAFAVLVAWITALAFFRLRSGYDRLHAITFFNLVGGGAMTAAVVIRDGLTSRTFQCVLVWLV